MIQQTTCRCVLTETSPLAVLSLSLRRSKRIIKNCWCPAAAVRLQGFVLCQPAAHQPAVNPLNITDPWTVSGSNTQPFCFCFSFFVDQEKFRLFTCWGVCEGSDVLFCSRKNKKANRNHTAEQLVFLFFVLCNWSIWWWTNSFTAVGAVMLYFDLYFENLVTNVKRRE